MQSANDYRDQAAACRRASNRGRRPTLYLLDLAEHYEFLATSLDARFCGAGSVAGRAGDTNDSPAGSAMPRT
jgi:hypothetical protein